MRNFTFATALMCGCLTGIASAQNAPRDIGLQTPAAAVQPTTGGASFSDQQIAALVHGAAHNEIEILKFAQAKIQAEEIRQFAEQMIREHTPGCEAMKNLAGHLANPPSATAASAPTTSATATAPLNVPSLAPRTAAPNPTPQPSADVHFSDVVTRGGSAAAGGSLDWLNIHKEMGQQCLADTKQELSAKEGSEFDHCFLGQQIGAHMHVITTLKVLRNYASAELRQKLDDELQLATTHLQHAKHLAEQMKDRQLERVSRKPE